MIKKEVLNERSKVFLLILYADDSSHMQVLDFVKANYDYAYIYHDKDTYEEDVETNGIVHKKGDLKKGHYHVVLRFKNQRYKKALAKELELAENYIEVCHDFKRALLYLIHYYDEDKYQYLPDDVVGTLKSKLIEYCKNDGKTESEKILEIFSEIDSYEAQIDFMVFVKHVAKMGYWDVLRRSSSIIMRYIDCHNLKYRV